MIKKCHYCGWNAELIGKNWDNEDVFRCRKCGKQGRDNCFSDRLTVFHRITASPEVLAAELVYHDEEHEIAFSVVIRGVEQRMGHECWRSTIIPGACWAEYDRAYAATVARLKEVCVEQNAVDDTQARLCKTDHTQKEVK